MVLIPNVMYSHVSLCAQGVLQHDQVCVDRC